jgi:hydroxyethylthiazole kinase-like uncharacterized protein yjeF
VEAETTSVSSVIRLEAQYCAGLVAVRDPDGHKGTFGTVLCLAGSLDYAGAGLLTALGAARAGAGLVALAVPASLQSIFAGRIPEVVTLGLAELEDGADVDPAKARAQVLEREADALVMGPGLRESEAFRSLVDGLMTWPGAPAVVDGGALNLLSRTEQWWADTRRACVLTPHPGEFARLTGWRVGPGDDERAQRALEASQRFKDVLVLKGARTVIAAPDGRVALAPFANPALATAGSGDVLAGVIGALLAQGKDPYDAACLAVFLHGTAGERISARLGDSGLIASDLPYEIAVARADLAKARG